MWQLLNGELVVWIVALAVVLTVLILAVTFIKKLLWSDEDSGTGASTDLTFFREMKERGEISETEYRNIKATMTAKLKAEFEQRDAKEQSS